MFEKDKQPSPTRQRQLDRYARLVDSLSPKSKMYPKNPLKHGYSRLERMK